MTRIHISHSVQYYAAQFRVPGAVAVVAVLLPVLQVVGVPLHHLADILIVPLVVVVVVASHYVGTTSSSLSSNRYLAGLGCQCHSVAAVWCLRVIVGYSEALCQERSQQA